MGLRGSRRSRRDENMMNLEEQEEMYDLVYTCASEELQSTKES